ncbi:MAG: hypothetical protein ACUVRD_00270 [Bacteroidia bacterium]
MPSLPSSSPKTWWSLPLYPPWGHPYNKVQEIFLDAWARTQGSLRTFRWWQWPARYVYWDIVIYHGLWIDFQIFFPRGKSLYLPRPLVSYLLQEGPPTRVYADFTPLGHALSRVYKVAYEVFFWGERFSVAPLFRWRTYRWLKKAQVIKAFCPSDGQRFEKQWRIPVEVISPMWQLSLTPSGQKDKLLIHVPSDARVKVDTSIKRAYALGAGEVYGHAEVRSYVDVSYEELIHLIRTVGIVQEWDKSIFSPIRGISEGLGSGGNNL